MSELSGRASNGGARTGGPVPVSSSLPSSNIRTPTEIMRERNAREQRRREEQKATEEQRRLAEERRRNAERRAAAIQGTTAPRNSGASSQYTPESVSQPFDRRSGTAPVAGSDTLGAPTGRTTQDYSSSRIRGPSVSQEGQPRPAPPTASAPRRTQPTQPTQPAPRPATSSAVPGASSSQDQPPAQPDNSGAPVTFPHAFHRWETLSSHWEGLTSFWLRRLEENTEKIRDTIPNITTLNRQITDLSAAGANLFHAVVELQRLRASSERKFQRWFFDTKGESEKNREIQGQMENRLNLEREEFARQRKDLQLLADNAKRDAAEAKRELIITKDEAKRAWEELGRRNQESLETAQSLKDGRITIVHGVQVVPYHAGAASRSGSASARPVTRDGQGYYGSTGLGGGGFASPGDEARYEYQYGQEGSPTNTDPFMETGPTVQPYSSVDPKQTYQQGYQVGGTPTTSSTAQTAIPPTSNQRIAPVTTQEAQRFYQHDPHETFLHGQQPPADLPGQSEASYISSPEEVLSPSGAGAAPTEYILNPDGTIKRDSDGRPLLTTTTSTTRRRAPTGNTEDDDWDTEADRLHEDELSARYGTGLLPPPEVPTVPGTSGEAMASYASSAQGSLAPDYEGAGFVAGRHHHPTRLSDVLEEEEERSSRRTGE